MPSNMNKYSILRVASSGVVYGTQESRHAQNESWELLIRNISPHVHNSLGQFNYICWGVVYVAQSTWDFLPKLLDRVQIRSHIGPIHVLNTLIFEEIHEPRELVCAFEHNHLDDTATIWICRWTQGVANDHHTSSSAHAPTQIAFVGVFFAVGTSSQVLLPNNQRSIFHQPSWDRNIGETDPVGTGLRWRFCSAIIIGWSEALGHCPG